MLEQSFIIKTGLQLLLDFRKVGLGGEDRSQGEWHELSCTFQAKDKVHFMHCCSSNFWETKIHITSKFLFQVGFVLQTSQRATGSIKMLLHTANSMLTMGGSLEISEKQDCIQHFTTVQKCHPAAFMLCSPRLACFLGNPSRTQKVFLCTISVPASNLVRSHNNLPDQCR